MKGHLALQLYRNVVATVGNVYRTDLNFSVSDAGHWTGELALLEKAYEQLKNSEVKNKIVAPAIDFRDATDREAPKVVHTPIIIVEPGRKLSIAARITDKSGVKIKVTKKHPLKS